MAAMGSTSGTRLGAHLHPQEDVFSTLSASLPTASKRRIKQSILLAQRLMEKHRECERLTRELTAAQQQVSYLTEQVHSATSKLTHVEQPYNFLVDTIGHRESALKAAQVAHAAVTHDLQVMTQHYHAAVADKHALAAELDRLLQTRQNLDVLRHMLASAKTVATMNLPVDKVPLTLPESPAAAAAAAEHGPSAAVAVAAGDATLSSMMRFLNDVEVKKQSAIESAGPRLPSTLTAAPQLKTTSRPPTSTQPHADAPKPLWFQQLNAKRK